MVVAAQHAFGNIVSKGNSSDTLPLSILWNNTLTELSSDWQKTLAPE